MYRYTITQKKNLTVHNCLERFLQMSIRPLEVLIIIAAPKRAVIHQLQSDMNRHTVIFGYDIPIFVYVVENPLFKKSISSSVYLWLSMLIENRDALQLDSRNATSTVVALSVGVEQ